ncbi:MAG TPA: homoserine O-succinyltransferase [Levilinea sp.]|nr:homoserine O-succinyltransferase [Levilinea sp.]
MAVIVPAGLPAIQTLAKEQVPVFARNGRVRKSLHIGIVNLMPTKVTTETQLLRLLGHSPLDIDVTLLRMESHHSRHTPEEHLLSFYQTYAGVRNSHYDGLIITGAPVENLPFEEVDYWDELVEIIDWSRRRVRSTLFICWGAQAGLYRFYGVPKHALPEKQFGVFPHRAARSGIPLLSGFDDTFYAPHSRHTETRSRDLERIEELEILVESDEAGLYIAGSSDGRQIYVTGHSEYDALTLKSEYERDVKLGLPIQVPKNYYPNDDPGQLPRVLWRSHASLLFGNWLHKYVRSRSHI